MSENTSSATTFPSWTFHIPGDVIAAGFQIAVFGHDPLSGKYCYWSDKQNSYVDFPVASGTTYMTAPLIQISEPGSSPKALAYPLQLPTETPIESGIVAMFIGDTIGIPVSDGNPSAPTATSNPNDIFGIFEMTYETANLEGPGSPPSLDVDISNIDQTAFTYLVSSDGYAPFPLSTVGSSVPRTALFRKFKDAIADDNPFRACLDGQLRINAPQDVLQGASPPHLPGFCGPSGTPPSVPTPFVSDHSYFYKFSESSPTGETVPTEAIFGGYLLNKSGSPQASNIEISWMGPYPKMNPDATSINIYRADVAPLTVGKQPVAPTENDAYGLICSMSIDAWNKQPGYAYYDEAVATGSQTPKTTSCGFNPLSTWFDKTLADFSIHYQTQPFSFYQFHQSGLNPGSNGTLWRGKVKFVRPDKGKPITTDTYISHDGTAKTIPATWQWGDGSRTYNVLQLVGNAYDNTDYTNTKISGESGLYKGEYQGAVVNIYLPCIFSDDHAFADGNDDTNGMPPWIPNASYSLSQMVFACTGVFASSNDPDACAQTKDFSDLAGTALTNLENVLVSALNRGVATGYDYALGPQQYICLYSFSGLPAPASSKKKVPPGLYTYYLSATLNDGSETALTWGVSVVMSKSESHALCLKWLPQPVALYSQVNVYRRKGAGAIELIGTVSNVTGAPATTYTDEGGPLPTQPDKGQPYAFYPSWRKPGGAGYAPSNLYSAFLHQNATADTDNGISINGLVYGYPYDDMGSFSTDIGYGSHFPSGISFFISLLNSDGT